MKRLLLPFLIGFAACVAFLLNGNLYVARRAGQELTFIQYAHMLVGAIGVGAIVCGLVFLRHWMKRRR